MELYFFLMQWQQFKRKGMRNRQMVEYLLYPKFFNAHSILYKGTYCVSFTLYTLSKTKTAHAFPFLVTPPALRFNPDAKEQPSLHTDGNFSFLTHKFEIVYEEERKRLDSACVFRVEMDLNRDYRVYLRVRLLRKCTGGRGEEEMGLCVRKVVDYRYQTIDQELLEVKREESLNHYERVFFRASEFYSSVDFYLATFNYGYKYYRSKLTIPHLLAGIDLNLHNPVGRMKEKCEAGGGGSEEVLRWRGELLQDESVCLPTYYYELLKVIVEYSRLVGEYHSFQRLLLDGQRDIQLPLPTFPDLDYIKMHDKVTLNTLSQHFQANSPEEIMGHIFEQKQLMRRHIRRVREEFCLLMPLQNQRQFGEMIKKQMDDQQSAETNSFVRYVTDLMPLEQAPQCSARSEAIAEFTRSRSLWNTRINSAPYFYIQSSTHVPAPPPRRPSLTVFVHGYQGNSFDFQKAKNYLRRHNKHTHVLIVESITNDMNQSIDSLGQKVAEEVRNQLDKRIFEFSQINFVGFSLGGLIARAAFGKLREYWGLFNLFVTFSSPHMGISECENSLINLGVWYLIKVDKVKNLKELNFQSVNFNDSLLMRLSRCQALTQFNKVVLVCSKNDGFVPYYSTVLDQRNCDKQELKELCRNMTRGMREVERVELVFDLGKSGALDKLTGRKGHIQFLDNDYFLDIFFQLYGPAM